MLIFVPIFTTAAQGVFTVYYNHTGIIVNISIVKYLPCFCFSKKVKKLSLILIEQLIPTNQFG